MLVSWGCLDKVPPTGGLKTTGTYCLPVLEVRSPKSRCLQGCFLLRPGGGTGSMPLSRLLELPASLGCPRACRGIASVSSVFTGSSVSVAKFPFSYKCISLSGIVTLITSAKSLIPNKITFPHTGVRTQCIFLGGQISSPDSNLPKPKVPQCQ